MTGTKPVRRKPRAFAPDGSDVDAIVAGIARRSVRGARPARGADGAFVARCFIPGADDVTAFTLDGKHCGALASAHDAGFFEGALNDQEAPAAAATAPRNAGGEWWVTDPYTLRPGARADGRLLHRARASHLRLFDKLGAHLIDHEGASGVHFAVWAPNARRVSVVGDFNDWDGRRHVDAAAPRHRHLGNLHARTSAPGRAYKFEIIGAERRAAAAEGRSLRLRARNCGPKTASVIARPPSTATGATRRTGAFWRNGRCAARADLDLRGASGLLAARRRRLVPDLGRDWPTG